MPDAARARRKIAQVVFARGRSSKSRDLSGPAPARLLRGVYRFANARTMCGSRRLAFCPAPIGSAATARTKPRRPGWCRPTASIIADIVRMARAALARDLINTPSNDMARRAGAAAQSVGERGSARLNCIVGDELVSRTFR